MADYELTFQTVSIPTGSGGASVTIEEDADNSGTTDNSEVVALSDGVTSYTTSSGSFAGSGQVRLVWSLGPPSDVETTSATVVPADVVGPPDAPPNLTVDEVADAPSVALSWSDVSGEDEYRIYRATSPGSVVGDYTQIDTVAADTTTYTDTTVSLNTRYYYRVTAYNTSTGESSPSNEVRAEPNVDEFTESITWDSEAEWGYGSFTDTTTDGSGALVLGDIASPQTFDYSLSASEDASVGGFTTVTAEIRDASSGTVLDSDTIQVSNDGDSRTGTFTIDTGTHPDLEFYVEVDLDNSGGGSDGSASISGPVDYTSGTIVSAYRNSNAGTTTDTQTNTYTYTESGSWTSPDWDYGSTTTATRLSWSGVSLPNPGDSITVTITEVGGGTTAQVTPTSGSGSELFDLAPGDTYRVDVSLSTVDDSTTPSVGSLTLETHTPTTNLTVTGTRDTEVDLSWDEISVCDGYEIYQSQSTPVDTSGGFDAATTDPTDTTVTVTGLENGEQYYFNVRPIYSGE